MRPTPQPPRDVAADFAIGTSKMMTSVLPERVDTAWKVLGLQLAEGGLNVRTGIDALTGNLDPNRDRILRAALAAG